MGTWTQASGYLKAKRRVPGSNPLAVRTQICHVAAIRSFFKWLTRERYVASNPASELIPPRKEFRLPGNVLSPPQVELVLSMPDIKDPVGLRDRAIMETFYSAGIRRMELIHLTPQDLDRERGLVLVRLGKGKKDRIVPIGERALLWIDKYMQEVRPMLLVGHQVDDPLFLSDKGKPLKPNFLSQMVGRYVEASGVRQYGACHLFRHAMATAMLDNGADVRFVQEMLGHANLQTTAIYTHVAVAKLKQIHDATHPAKIKRSEVNIDKLGKLGKIKSSGTSPPLSETHFETTSSWRASHEIGGIRRLFCDACHRVPTGRARGRYGTRSRQCQRQNQQSHLFRRCSYSASLVAA